MAESKSLARMGRWLAARDDVALSAVLPLVLGVPFGAIFYLLVYGLDIPEDGRSSLGWIFALLYGLMGGLIFRWICSYKKIQSKELQKDSIANKDD